jgi:(p)ppGpp synthase/HD superfamily hydrolase
MNNLRQIGFDISSSAHNGQKRNNGDDYISHPVAVEQIALTANSDKTYLNLNRLSFLSLMHDVLKDTIWTEEEIKKVLLDNNIEGADDILMDLRALNKKNFSSYIDYILFIKDYGGYAKLVKIADLTHNLSDLKTGSLRDKYELSMYILTS